MSQKNHLPGPIPPGNQPGHGGTPAIGKPDLDPDGGAPDSNLDPEHRKGDFTGKGDAPIIQPGPARGKRDGNS